MKQIYLLQVSDMNHEVSIPILAIEDEEFAKYYDENRKDFETFGVSLVRLPLIKSVESVINNG